MYGRSDLLIKKTISENLYRKPDLKTWLSMPSPKVSKTRSCISRLSLDKQFLYFMIVMLIALKSKRDKGATDFNTFFSQNKLIKI